MDRGHRSKSSARRFMFILDETLKLVRRQTRARVGDVMLDAFVYGEVNRISPEAPVQVLTVGSSETRRRRRRQRGAQCRGARRALRVRQRDRRRRGGGARSTRR